MTGSNSHITILILNINGLNAPIKTQRLAHWIKCQDPPVWHIPMRDPSHVQRTHRLKIKGWRNIDQENGKQKKSRGCDKTDFKTTKNKISLAWWCTPVIPGTRVAEAGESLQTGRQRLQWAETMRLHSSLSNRLRLYLRKQNKTKNNTIKKWPKDMNKHFQKKTCMRPTNIWNKAQNHWSLEKFNSNHNDISSPTNQNGY